MINTSNKDDREKKIFELNNLISQLDKEGDYFLDFLKIRNFEAGIMVLRPNKEDTQGSHSTDELYYIIKGTGFIKLDGSKNPIREGSIIFVPAGMPHNFFGNNEILVLIYILVE